VWGDLRTGNFAVHLLDLVTKVDQPINPGFTPDISGNKIIYTGFTSTGAIDIFAFDLGTSENFPLTELAAGTRAFISGNRVVYSDNRKGHWQIFLYDLLTKNEFPLTDGLFDARYPMIDGDRLVYMGDIDGHWQIFETSILSDAPPIFTAPGPGPADGVPMPEPNTWMLLGSGLLVLLWLRKVKKHEAH
jgi:beta propeller repeat protein